MSTSWVGGFGIRHLSLERHLSSPAVTALPRVRVPARGAEGIGCRWKRMAGLLDGIGTASAHLSAQYCDDGRSMLCSFLWPRVVFASSDGRRVSTWSSRAGITSDKTGKKVEVNLFHHWFFGTGFKLSLVSQNGAPPWRRCGGPLSRLFLACLCRGCRPESHRAGKPDLWATGEGRIHLKDQPFN